MKLKLVLEDDLGNFEEYFKIHYNSEELEDIFVIHGFNIDKVITDFSRQYIMEDIDRCLMTVCLKHFEALKKKVGEDGGNN